LGQSFAVDRRESAPHGSRARMKSEGFLKSVILVGLTVIALYFVAFYAIEGCRRAKGPWEVTFATNEMGPALTVKQPRLNYNCVIRFHGEKAAATNLPQTVRFDRPKKPVPFGKVIYEDLTQFPGVVTFDLFGHEIELIRRALTVNKRQIPWNAQRSVDLWPTNKLAQPPKPRPSWN
jgi:hypothetical protein